MGAIYTETHFKSRPQAVTELYFHLCIDEGFRQADVREVGLGQVEKELNGPVVVDGEPLDGEDLDDLLLVTPRDRSGWCVAYSTGHILGERLVERLGHVCPIDEAEKTWEQRLDIDAAVHGYMRQDDHGWGWVLRRDGQSTAYARTGPQDARPGKDISSAFATVGRLFGEVGIEMVLHRLLNVTRPPDLDAHLLCWATRTRASIA